MVMKDKAYDELDDISKLVEPWDMASWRLLNKVPDEICFSIEHLQAIFEGRSSSYNRDIVNDVIEPILVGEEKWVVEILEFVLDRESLSKHTEDFWVDFSSGEMNGKVFISTNKPSLKDMPQMVMRYAIQKYTVTTAGDPGRTREVLRVFGVDTNRRNMRQLLPILHNTMMSIIKDDTWRIRSDKVIVDMAQWVNTYIMKGNYSAYANLLNLKCMVHKGNPIYSTEEIG